jgi:hemolysin D
MKASIRNLVPALRRPPPAGEALSYASSRTAVLHDAIAFQGPIDQISDERPPFLMRSTHYIVAALFISLLIIASLVKVEVVVLGTGRLATDVPSIVVQPLDRAIIREVRVKPGDTVTKGQVLAILDSTFTQADLVSLTAQQGAVTARIRRIEAELGGQPFDVGDDPSPDDKLQATLDQQRSAQYKSQLRVFDQDIQRLRASIRTTEDDRALLTKQLEIAQNVQDMRSTLMQKEVGSKLQFLDSQTNRLRTEQDFRNASNHLIELTIGAQSKEAERQVFIDDWHRQLLEGLVDARAQDHLTELGLAKAAHMNDLVILTAPDDGTVTEVAQRSVGSVLREAEPLVTIVPSNAPLIADITINSSDIGYTKPGDEVFIKIDAFPYQRHGMLKGRLLSVSEESFAANSTGGQDIPAPPGGGSAFHRARVELLSTTLKNLPEGVRIIPGMTLSAEINVGSRSVMAYFLYPITRGLRESLREP